MSAEPKFDGRLPEQLFRRFAEGEALAGGTFSPPNSIDQGDKGMISVPWTKRNVLAVAVAAGFASLAAPVAADDDELPLGAAVVIIETTDNDIELQVFVDGTPVWDRLEIFDPRDRRIFNLRTQRRLGRQGLSELTFASTPDPFPVDATGEIDPVGTIDVVEAFLSRFPAGSTKWRPGYQAAASWRATGC